MKSYRLTIIRHGHTEGNEKAQYIGTTDIPLSESGKTELREKKEQFEYPKVQRVYSSPLIRCIQTADILFPDRELVTVDGLRELDFGDFEGQTVDDLIELESYKEWLKGGMDNNAHNGESLREMIGRSLAALNEIIKDMMDERLHDCAIVTHSGIMMNMLSCFGLPKLEPMSFACDVGEGYMISVNLQMWQTGGVFEIMGKVPYEKEYDDGDEF